MQIHGSCDRDVRSGSGDGDVTVMVMAVVSVAVTVAVTVVVVVTVTVAGMMTVTATLQFPNIDWRDSPSRPVWDSPATTGGCDGCSAVGSW